MVQQPDFNPFVINQPAHEYFVGREKELNRLHTYLQQARGGRPSNLYIVGGGGDGKTSFLLKAVEEAQQHGLLAVYYPIDKVTGHLHLLRMLIEYVLEDLAKRSGDGEHLRDFTKKDTDRSSFFRLPDLQEIATKYLKDDLERLLQLCQAQGIPAVVLCLDEGQNLETIDGGLLAHLRGAIQELGRGYMLVLASLTDIMPKLSEEYVGVDRFFPNRLTLGAFDTDAEARQCIDRRLRDASIKFTPAATDLIVRISGRHPREIISISHHGFNRAVDSKAGIVTEEVVREVVYTEFDDRVSSAKEQVARLLPTEEDTLRDLVFAGGTATAREIATTTCGPQKQALVDRMTATVTSDLAGLCRYGICRRVAASSAEKREDDYQVVDAMSLYVLRDLLR